MNAKARAAILITSSVLSCALIGGGALLAMSSILPATGTAMVQATDSDAPTASADGKTYSIATLTVRGPEGWDGIVYKNEGTIELRKVSDRMLVKNYSDGKQFIKNTTKEAKDTRGVNQATTNDDDNDKTKTPPDGLHYKGEHLVKGALSNTREYETITEFSGVKLDSTYELFVPMEDVVEGTTYEIVMTSPIIVESPVNPLGEEVLTIVPCQIDISAKQQKSAEENLPMANKLDVICQVITCDPNDPDSVQAAENNVTRANRLNPWRYDNSGNRSQRGTKNNQVSTTGNTAGWHFGTSNVPLNSGENVSVDESQVSGTTPAPNIPQDPTVQPPAQPATPQEPEPGFSYRDPSQDEDWGGLSLEQKIERAEQCLPGITSGPVATPIGTFAMLKDGTIYSGCNGQQAIWCSCDHLFWNYDDLIAHQDGGYWVTGGKFDQEIAQYGYITQETIDAAMDWADTHNGWKQWGYDIAGNVIDW